MATNGVAAVELATTRDFDLILMDLQMPVLDGLSATKQIRSKEHELALSRLPVIAYTSCALEQKLLRDCGVDGVLEKPCSPDALEECLLRWCASRSGFAIDELACATAGD